MIANTSGNELCWSCAILDHTHKQYRKVMDQWSEKLITMLSKCGSDRRQASPARR